MQPNNMPSLLGMSGAAADLGPSAECLPRKRRKIVPLPIPFEPMAPKTKDLLLRASWINRAVDPHVVRNINRDPKFPYDPVREGVDIMQWVEQQRTFIADQQALCDQDPAYSEVDSTAEYGARVKDLWDATHNTPYARWPPMVWEDRKRPKPVAGGEAQMAPPEKRVNVHTMIASLSLVMKETEENEAHVCWY